MAPTWHWSGKPFLLDLCIRLSGLDGAKDGKALSGIACAWEIEQKRACHRWVFSGDEPRGVSLIGGPDFGCVSVRICPCMILLKSGGYSSWMSSLAEAPKCVCAADRLCIFSDF